MVKDISGSGSIIGAVPYSGMINGCGAGFRRNDDGMWYEPTATIADTQFILTDSRYRDASVYRNKWVHIAMVCNGNEFRATYSDCEKGIVYVDNQPIAIYNDVGTALCPVNKMVFGLSFTRDKGSGTICIRDFEFY